MLTKVRSVGIYVSDQQRALDFYTQVLGCTLVSDQPMGPGADAPRWIEVRLPQDDTLLILFTPQGQEDRIGQFSNVLFHCDDIEQTHRELTARGVEFAEAPRKEFWGWWAVFKDPDGNSYGLGQRGE